MHSRIFIDFNRLIKIALCAPGFMCNLVSEIVHAWALLILLLIYNSFNCGSFFSIGLPKGLWRKLIKHCEKSLKIYKIPSLPNNVASTFQKIGYNRSFIAWDTIFLFFFVLIYPTLEGGK